MMLLIYETGCRVSEFVQIPLKHLDFLNSYVFFPAANTKTKHQCTSHIPRGLMNYIAMLDYVHPDDKGKAKFRLNEKRTGDRKTKFLELKMLTKCKRKVSIEFNSNSLFIEYLLHGLKQVPVIIKKKFVRLAHNFEVWIFLDLS